MSVTSKLCSKRSIMMKFYENSSRQSQLRHLCKSKKEEPSGMVLVSIGEKDVRSMNKTTRPLKKRQKRNSLNLNFRPPIMKYWTTMINTRDILQWKSTRTHSLRLLLRLNSRWAMTRTHDFSYFLDKIINTST